MKKTIIAAVLAVAAGAAFAKCPPYAPYGCTQMPNGKQLCGCGQG